MIRTILGRRGAGGRFVAAWAPTSALVWACNAVALRTAARKQAHFAKETLLKISFITDRQCGAVKSSSLLERYSYPTAQARENYFANSRPRGNLSLCRLTKQRKAHPNNPVMRQP